MLKIIFSFVIFIHGLIHLLGFVKEWNLASINQLTGETLIPLSGWSSKIAGIFWLSGSLFFIASGIIYLFRKDWWWMIAVTAIIISQILIIIYWKDAKIGTIANIFILIASIFSYGTWSFNRMTQNEINSLSPKKETEKKIITLEMINNLPPIIQKWLTRSNIIGKEIIQAAYLKQKGKMKTKPEGKWMSVDAEQYITIDPPGFIWVADVKSPPFLHLSGRDKYENGKGHMLIKLFSLIPVVNVSGKEIDQGALLRFLGEIVWIPSAVLSDYIKWEEIDSLTAKATMSYGGITASGIFRFDKNGDFVSFEAQRYYYRKEGSTLEKWVITADKKYKEFEGIRVPVSLSVTWKFKTGDFTWYKVEITEIKYNKLKEK